MLEQWYWQTLQLFYLLYVGSRGLPLQGPGVYLTLAPATSLCTATLLERRLGL